MTAVSAGELDDIQINIETPASEAWSVFAYGTNLTDEEYHSFGQLIQTNSVIYQGTPREIGVGVNARFGR